MNELFKNKEIKVFMNPSGEVFVKNLNTRAVIRISNSFYRTIITADYPMTPWAFNGQSAMYVKGNDQ